MTTTLHRRIPTPKTHTLSYTGFGWLCLFALPALNWMVIMRGTFEIGVSSTHAFYWGVLAGILTLIVWIGVGISPRE